MPFSPERAKYHSEGCKPFDTKKFIPQALEGRNTLGKGVALRYFCSEVTC